MFSLSPMKVFIIVAVVIILLGPDKLPEVAHKLGSTWQSLRRFQQRIEDEVRGSLPDLPSTGDIARMARNPVSMLNQLADRAAPVGEVDTESSVPPPLREPVAPPAHATPHSSDVAAGPASADPSLN